ncbi:MAG: folate-binding protein YgfZ [Rhodobacteraceae bacterium]|nr:folate-binding protein YgfZ [Paracoccaceae bacterium]
MTGEWASDRTVLRVSGGDAAKFLQDLVTNDLRNLTSGLIYAALLTPQGKYLFDFFIKAEGDSFLLDVKSDQAAALAQRLTLYRLRADVKIKDSALSVNRGLGTAPGDGSADPRHCALGWRSYSQQQGSAPEIDWTAIRVAHCIPETGVELIGDSSYILESGFERLNGVDFKKGCYVGQEVTARMKHKTELRKGLVRVRVDGAAPVGTAISANGKDAGVLYSQSNGNGIAYLRLDRAKGVMTAASATITLS